MPYRIDNLTNERLSISSLYLYPGFPAWVDVLTDPLVEAHNKQLVLIDPPPGFSSGSSTVTIVGQTTPIQITVVPGQSLPIEESPITVDTAYADIGNAATLLVGTNANRRSLLIQNLAYTRSLWIAHSSADCVISQCILVPPRYYREFIDGAPDNEVWVLSEVTNPGGGPAESVARISYAEGV